MPSKKLAANNKNVPVEGLSPATLEIILDNDFDSDLFDEDIYQFIDYENTMSRGIKKAMK